MNHSLIHGQSFALYKRGCRCDACRGYQNARSRRNRADRITRLTVHGIRSSYDAGCRCDECKGARREAYLRLASEYPRQAAGKPGPGIPEMAGVA